MYSGYLLLMMSLYAMLFDNDEFEKPGSIKFTWDPLFWGMGTEVFEYDNRSLQDVILKGVEGNGWLGVCCEPNLVFVVIAVRYYDIREGTKLVAEMTQKYSEAWDKKGMVQPDGMYADWLMLKQDVTIPPRDVPYGAMPLRQIGFTAWANAFLHAWNPSLVRPLFDAQSKGHFTRINNQYHAHPDGFANPFGHLVRTQNADPTSKIPQLTPIANPFPPTYTYGVLTQWLSELPGKAEILPDLLASADTHLNPTWERSGLYYPRQDEQLPDTADTGITYMNPFSGNAPMGYARLNVPNGQNIMYTSPWTKEDLAKRPYVDGVMELII
ncbi:hypothetical protein T440DRAFT_552383 [Plenodomus tracheiphilus IPT5]|uniref:Linalool dehydratase/isomerase domain-containing protein n=1 Tax=Plenodomus tracheiphilus IPT5 TaxID=1408161 RepID=A0A6A7BEJ4_9PLEO|nr:hypothetical protein T440DRAFT_552383 [Plenodomus tracheiphilus IPT5]